MLSLRRLSLGTRLTLLAVATLSPVVVLTVLSYVEDRNDARDETIEEVGRYADSLAAGLENFARDLDTLTQSAALALANQLGPINNENSQGFLAALVGQNELFQFIFVTDLEGRVIAQNSGDDTGTDLSSRPYIQDLVAGQETAWSGALDGLRSGEITVAYARVIREASGEPEAFLVVAFHSVGLVDRLPADLPAEGHIVLVDQHGQAVFSSRDPDFENFPRDLSDSPTISAALNGETVVIDGRETLFDDGRRFGSVQPIPSMDWALAYTRSQERLESTLTEQLWRDLGILTLIGIVSISVLVVISRQVTRPLADLSRAVTDITENQPVAALRPTTEPDISRLQQAFMDMSAAVREREAQLADQARVLDTIEQVGASLASNLELDSTVQAVTDAGTRLTEAEFGAFFYNVVGDDGATYQLFALSGADRGQFEQFAMPRATNLFGPTFRGEGVVRMDDVREDERYGQNPPHFGMPEGHLPVRSYLALPVVSASREVVGGLFFGHSQPARFTARHEQLAAGIAAWAAISFDNARLYREARLVQEQLAAANRSKDEFLSLVSHELRTPITIIGVGAARLLRLSEETDAEQRGVLEDVANNAARLSELVQNLLVLARPGLASKDEFEPMLVRPIVQGITEQFRERRPDRPLRFVSQAGDAVVLGSQLYLEQLLLNLVSNADKYSPAGDQVVVMLRADSIWTEIAVRDRGPGLSDDDVAHLFEPYYRGQAAQKQASGFGLGLAVCQRLAQAMDGELVYEAGAEGGATFTLRLPAFAGEVADMDLAEPMSDASAVPGN